MQMMALVLCDILCPVSIIVHKTVWSVARLPNGYIAHLKDYPPYNNGRWPDRTVVYLVFVACRVLGTLVLCI
ncbi:unnamed protein product [Absidia cylindrospora]